MKSNSCPLCGAVVLYRGLNTLECAGSDCENKSSKQTPEQYIQELMRKLETEGWTGYWG